MQSKFETPQDTNNSRSIKVKGLNLDEPAIMGILNVTPDSFFDGGKLLSDENIVRKVNSMEYDGAKIIDIGGHSTRPGAQDVSEEEELKRVLPIVQLVSSNCPDMLISIDTFRSNIAEKCIENGAHIINDISGGNFDNKMFDCVSNLKVPYVLMHIQGTPQDMHLNPTYKNVVEEVHQYFEERVNRLNQLGVNDIILDPGFGFGKTIEHNFDLLNNLDVFKSFNLPVLAGMSRKGMINKVLKTTPDEALIGTTVLNTIALSKGANILRVHDVKEANETIKLVNKLK